MFGGNRSAFGGGGQFGGGGGGSFGSQASASPFGAGPQQQQQGGFGAFGGGVSGGNPSPFASGAVGGAAGASAPVGSGTAIKPFTAFQDKDPTTNVTNCYQSITCMPEYRNFSFEELRFQDYAANRKTAGAPPATTQFGAGANAGSGLFGNNQNASSAAPFGMASRNATSNGSLFGQQPNTAAAPTTGGMFGQQGGNSFGAGNTGNTGLFGQNNQQQQQQSGGLFGQQPQQPAGGVFSAPAANTGGLFGQNNQQRAGGLFGQNAQQQQPAGGLFGQGTQQQQPAGGLFGQKPATTGGLFGQNNQTSGNLFGQQNQQQQQQQQQPSGFFGQQPSGAQSSSLFGQQRQAGGLFGQKPATVGNTGPLFGQTAQQPQQQASGGLFGSNNNTQQQGGLFGQGQPAAGTGGGLFGNTNSSATGGLFGSKPAATGGLFGSNNNTNAGNSTLAGAKPLFGGTNSTSTGGLFGAKQQTAPTGQNTLFGSQSTAPTGSTLGGGLFTGNKAANTSLSGAPGTLFGTTANSTLGGQSALQQQNQQQQQQQQQQLNSIKNNPYGTNELFAKIAPSGSQILSVLKAGRSKLNADVKQKASLTSAYRNAPKPLFAPIFVRQPAAVEDSASSNTSNRSKNGSFTSSTTKAIGLLEENNEVAVSASKEIDESIVSLNKLLFNPEKKSFKNLIMHKKMMEEEQNKKAQQVSLDKSPEETEPTAGAEKVTDETKQLDEKSTEKVCKNDKESPIKETNVAAKEKVPTDKKVSKPPGCLSDDFSWAGSDYYISPSLETLSSMTLMDLKRVKNLLIGHKMFGYIEFLDSVDLSKIPLASLCGKIVVFESKRCIVYPGDVESPEAGEGLNVKARITCYNCFPVNKATRLPIKEPHHPLVKRHIERFKKLPYTKFEKYDPQTGVYTFIAPHPVLN
ncbi:uncharacterized protein KNAG_0M02360 [Huiozyma naganishii CBS 8797]|uniref:Peptidase S59 domain-containing protein n=1 Tax=Huiozyma naganishii (strain ATCC MYA-139 / BCRC 22969 / CBS 8797 / KCTC 17520 / NBRC 10181 / NCYC 3082 / Yp74L-3) TaxID=1071383 RepID=J7SAV6_HUIN7|nr:hypothetical protein KNAG_0M02360 [Kazachstania naganishii CBS 8797]CCK73089.1 hypothetical protein KNAG_0M02360 [Kazachstania naganishii CBS 8797]